MIPPLFRRPDPTIAALYGAIVTQARDPRFCGSKGAPDAVLDRSTSAPKAVLLRRGLSPPMCGVRWTNSMAGD
jgi:hypothetical protein